MPRSGAMMVFPSLVKEYSTVMAFALVRLTINPVASRLRRVLVSMRCETAPRCRRNCQCRQGLSYSENKIFGVHLPMKIGETTFDVCIMFIRPLLLRNLSA